MEVNFWRAQNVTLDGLTIRGGQFTGATTKHITIRNSRFTAMLIFRETEAGVLSDADVLLDHNTYRDIMLPKASYAGRISLIYDLPPGQRSGVTISNSLFAGGNTDGIQTSVGVDIIGNEFADLREKNAKDSAHTDSIQLLGAPGSVVRGNYFHGVATGIVAYDGVKSALIEDNVIDTDRPWGIELYADQGSTIRHNTLRYGRCIFHKPCAQIDLTRKLVNAPGHGTRILDNVANAINSSEGSSYAERTPQPRAGRPGAPRPARRRELRRRTASDELRGLRPRAGLAGQGRGQRRSRRRRPHRRPALTPRYPASRVHRPYARHVRAVPARHRRGLTYFTIIGLTHH